MTTMSSTSSSLSGTGSQKQEAPAPSTKNTSSQRGYTHTDAYSTGFVSIKEEPDESLMPESYWSKDNNATAELFKEEIETQDLLITVNDSEIVNLLQHNSGGRPSLLRKCLLESSDILDRQGGNCIAGNVGNYSNSHCNEIVKVVETEPLNDIEGLDWNTPENRSSTCINFKKIFEHENLLMSRSPCNDKKQGHDCSISLEAAEKNLKEVQQNEVIRNNIKQEQLHDLDEDLQAFSEGYLQCSNQFSTDHVSSDKYVSDCITTNNEPLGCIPENLNNLGVEQGAVMAPCSDEELEQNYSMDLEGIEGNQGVVQESGGGVIKIKQERFHDFDEDHQIALSPTSSDSNVYDNTRIIKSSLTISIPKEDLANVMLVQQVSCEVLSCKKESGRFGFKFPCVVCNEKFQTPVALVNHVVMHDVPVMFVFPECGKSFASEDALHKHEIEHKKLKLRKRQFQGIQGKEIFLPSKVSEGQTEDMSFSPRPKDNAKKCKVEQIPSGGTRLIKERKPYSAVTKRLISMSMASTGSKKTYHNNDSREDYEDTVCMHRKFFKTVPSKFKCIHCQEHFETSAALINHVSLHEVSVVVFCQECRRSFPTKESFHNHKAHHEKKLRPIKKEHETEPYKKLVTANEVPIKTIKVKREKIMREDYPMIPLEHFLTKQKDPSYILIIEKPSSGSKEKERSARTMYIDQSLGSTPCEVQTSDSNFKCIVCKELFLTLPDLVSHVGVHRMQVMFYCLDCKKIFPTEDAIDEHKRRKCFFKPVYSGIVRTQDEVSLLSENPDFEIPCIVCREIFGSFVALVKHVTIHAVPVTFICCECGKSYSDDDTFLTHKATHKHKKKLRFRIIIKEYKDVLVQKVFVPNTSSHGAEANMSSATAQEDEDIGKQKVQGPPAESGPKLQVPNNARGKTIFIDTPSEQLLQEWTSEPLRSDSLIARTKIVDFRGSKWRRSKATLN